MVLQAGGRFWALRRLCLQKRVLVGAALGLAVTLALRIAAGATAKLSGAAMRFGKKTTAKQVVDALAPGRSLAGRVAIVTGGNAGLGLETVKALAAAGCRVVVTSRDVEAGRRAVEKELKSQGQGGYTVPDADVEVKALDLADLASVAAFARDVAASEKRLDYLVLNAGVMALPQRTPTADGFEMQIGVNHFGHALLTRMLRPKLEAQAHPSRIVVLASTAHTFGKLDVRDLHFSAGPSAGYTAWGAYGASKLANVLFSRALARRLPKDGRIVTAAVHPGVIRTSLWRSTFANNFFGALLLDLTLADKNVPQGTATTVWACLAPELDAAGASGAYLADCAIAETSALGRDDSLAEELWEATERQLDAAVAKRGLGVEPKSSSCPPP